MDEFSLGERYRLELHWKEAIYEQEGVCKLIGAYFSGPVLAEAQKLNDEDKILLDFYLQYLILVRNPYVATLHWRGVSYEKDGTIKLKEAFITHDTELNRVPKLNNDDYLIIDTSDHEADKHAFTLVYKTHVVNGDTQLYNFRS